MKKIIKFLFTLVLFFTIPIVANAAECKLIKGTGKNIGDEIQCGTEYFYVVSNDGKEIKMLSKYNLYVGFEINQVAFDTSEEASEYYNNLTDTYRRESSTSNTDGKHYIMYARYLEYETVKQDQTALGAHGGEKGEPAYPQIGVTFVNQEEYLTGDENGNIILEGTLIGDYLDDYSKTLTNLGYKHNGVTLLSTVELFEMISVFNDGLKLNKDEFQYNYSNNAYRTSLLEYIPEEYNWIYGTTYWLKDYIGENGAFFIDTIGDLCYVDNCALEVNDWFEYWMGAGVRPLVSIDAETFIYKITAKTDGNGSIKPSSDTESTGNEVTFTVTPNKGYVLGEVKVIDEDGNVITFTDYKFTMPNANVVIEATFVPSNPDTADRNIIIAVILIIVGTFVIITSNKKVSWLK